MLTIDSVLPVNEDYGIEKGTPIARHFIDAYMNRVGDQISGLVLEFGMPTYASRLRCQFEIIDISTANGRATYHADICSAADCEALAGRFDAIICTAVLQLVADPVAAVANMHALLKPGGQLIVAEKAVSRIDRRLSDVDRWRFTQNGLALLMKPFASVEYSVYGNVYATSAYLVGLPADQIDPGKLDFVDPRHPLVTIAHGRK